jgi:D-arabinose 1-dehydrogenase-like Zn-dependent alcohol dehydrogenase
MKAVQVPKPNGGLDIVERDIPEPKARQVRVKVEACGVCHSDMFTVTGGWPGIDYPRVPGHEVVGIVDAVGPMYPNGRKACASAWAGTAAIADIAVPAARATSSPARRGRSRAFRTTAAMPST